VFKFSALFSKVYLKCVELDWTVLLVIAGVHYTISYYGFVLLGETALLEAGAFPYYYATTVSTVGYGDLSPTSEAGRAFFVAFVLPGGLTAFTVVLGKAISSFTEYFRKKASGMGDFSKVSGATVIIGYHEHRTVNMINEIKAGSNTDDSTVILISMKDMPGNLSERFVKAESLSNAADLRRGAVEHASRIVVYADNDDLTLTAVLAARSLNRSAHLVCYFTNAEKASLLGEHCDAEVIVSSGVELVARELNDPGSSSLLADLVSAQSGVATFSITVPEDSADVKRQNIAEQLSRDHGATLISICQKDSGTHIYDPRGSGALNPGDTIFYIGEKRVKGSALSWTRT